MDYLRICEVSGQDMRAIVDIKVDDGSSEETLRAALNLFYAAVESELNIDAADKYIKEMKGRLNGDVL